MATNQISPAMRISYNADSPILASIVLSDVRYIGAGTIPVVIFCASSLADAIV